MKKPLHYFILFTLIIVASKTQAQLTQLSNNTNIVSGIALGNIGILADSTGALWRTDGTVAGTVNFTSKVFVDSSVNKVILNSKVYFNGKAVGSGKELWVTDGTDAGTQLVKDIKSGSGSSSPRDLFVFNNTLYFFASTTAEGVELWKSDGTATGTVLVKDINPGTGNGFDKNSDAFFALNNVLYFTANDGTSGTELWKTDGTGAGTVMIKDINPGADSSNCANFTAIGNTLFFSATDAAHGTELWKSDGTSAGTVLVQDIQSGTESSNPQQFVQFNNKLFFITQSGFLIQTYKLYITDGSTVTFLRDFGLGAVLVNSVIINNKLYFTGYSLLQGFELWSSDGTAAGTKIFKDINPGLGNGLPIILPDYLSLMNDNTDVHTKLFNGKIFFIANDGTHGMELWITDGTTANTKMVKDLYPGVDTSFSLTAPSWFYTSNNLYFAANNGTTGVELFKTDGTEANTVLVKDINIGSRSSNPIMFMGLNNHIYLTADDGDNSSAARDLYVISDDVILPLKLLDFAATLNGKTVNLNWSTATETNTKNFVVQRSTDAVNFSNIGSVNAAGNSITMKDYNFVDASAFGTNAKTVYYRLQMADNDGKSSLSQVKSVQLSPNAIISVYPNPVKDKLHISVNGSLNNTTIKITDQSGKTVLVQKLQAAQAGNKNTINVSGLGNGVYYIQFMSGDNKQTTRFIKY